MQLHLLTEPAAGGVLVRGTVIEGPGGPLPEFPGALLMLIGAGDDPTLTESSLRQAAKRNFAGIVVKPRGRDMTELVLVAKQLGLVVLALGEEMSWREVAALLDAVLDSYLDTTEVKSSLAGEELFTIAEAIAATIGGSVAVEDLARRVLAYSSVPGQRIDALRSQGILDRRVPSLPTDAEKYGAVLSANGIVHFPTAGDELARAAIAIRAGTLQLGTIWVIEGDAGITKQGEHALEEGARLAALHVLRARRATEFDQQMRGELLMSLIEGTGDPRLALHRLRLPDGVPRALLVFGRSNDAAGPDMPMVALAAQEVVRQVNTLRPDAAVATVGQAIYVLIADPHPAAAATRFADTVLTALDRTVGQWISVGVGLDEACDRSLTAVRVEADAVLSVLAQPPAPRVATLRDVRVRVLLRHVGTELSRVPWLLDPALSGLVSRRVGGSELTASLMAWFEALFDVRKAADSLHVHPNTLRYRLRRIAEQTGLNLDDADECLGLWLQLRVERDAASGARR